MASTNKTTNLQLSQFIATDKPSWLSDYNADMLKIDTGYGTAIQDAASAVSGAASASAAAQAAQTTANSAETRSTNNATQITNILSGLSASKITGTPFNNASGSLSFYGCDYVSCAKFDINFSDLPTDTAVSGSITRFGFVSIVGNVFNAVVSTITGDTAIWLTTLYVQYNDSKWQTVPIYAYFDGTNTILFAGIPSTIFSQITSLGHICGNFVYIPTGTVTNI